jgi:hypothetical protein
MIRSKNAGLVVIDNVELKDMQKLDNILVRPTNREKGQVKLKGALKKPPKVSVKYGKISTERNIVYKNEPNENVSFVNPKRSINSGASNTNLRGTPYTTLTNDPNKFNVTLQNPDVFKRVSSKAVVGSVKTGIKEKEANVALGAKLKVKRTKQELDDTLELIKKEKLKEQIGKITHGRFGYNQELIDIIKNLKDTEPDLYIEYGGAEGITKSYYRHELQGAKNAPDKPVRDQTSFTNSQPTDPIIPNTSDPLGIGERKRLQTQAIRELEENSLAREKQQEAIREAERRYRRLEKPNPLFAKNDEQLHRTTLPKVAAHLDVQPVSQIAQDQQQDNLIDFENEVTTDFPALRGENYLYPAEEDIYGEEPQEQYLPEEEEEEYQELVPQPEEEELRYVDYTVEPLISKKIENKLYTRFNTYGSREYPRPLIYDKNTKKILQNSDVSPELDTQPKLGLPTASNLRAFNANEKLIINNVISRLQKTRGKQRASNLLPSPSPSYSEGNFSIPKKALDVTEEDLIEFSDPEDEDVIGQRRNLNEYPDIYGQEKPAVIASGRGKKLTKLQKVKLFNKSALDDFITVVVSQAEEMQDPVDAYSYAEFEVLKWLQKNKGKTLEQIPKTFISKIIKGIESDF